MEGQGTQLLHNSYCLRVFRDSTENIARKPMLSPSPYSEEAKNGYITSAAHGLRAHFH